MIKKSISSLLVLLLISLVVSSSVSVSAETASGNAGDNIFWSINTDTGEMFITGSGDMNDRYTEWQYTPYSVKYRNYVTKASVQEGITSIGNNAFCCFENLQEVSVPSTATKIGYYAFNNLFIIKAISVPSATFIDNHAFYNCYALTDIELGNSLSRINAYAFGNCSSLEHIYLPKSLTTIERYVFTGCSSLKDVYYQGSESDWNRISIDYGNDCLLNANIHYGINSDNGTTSSQNELKTGDTFLLGEYPQSEVIDNTIIASLNSSSTNWITYDYLDSDGQIIDSMKYKDVNYNGKKYRGVYFTEYRREGKQSENGYQKEHAYWFEYEPVEWILLNENTGLSICKNAIDSQPFHHTGSTINGIKANNYEKSDIRIWLTNQFVNDSFDSEETDCIIANTSVSDIPMNDYVFLLSKNEADGLSSNQKPTYSTDYANCQGASNNSDGHTQNWCTRTAAGDSYSIYYMQLKWGSYTVYYNWYDDTVWVTSLGVRPAVFVDVSKVAHLQEKYSHSELSFYNSSITGYIGEDLSSLVIFDSDYHGIAEIEYQSSNTDIVDVDVISLGEGNYITQGNEQIATIYLNFKKEGTATITATAPDGSTATLNVTVETKQLDPITSGLIYLSDSTAPIYTTLDSGWFYQDSNKYNHSISTLCSLILLSGYQSEDHLANSLQSLGFSVDREFLNLDTGRDEVNYFIVSKPISNNGHTDNLVFVGCIGSHNTQWNSNFDPYGTNSSTNYDDTDKLYGINHTGFNDAKNFIYQRLTAYLSRYNYEKNNTKILLTGHSRGAATANLLGAKLIDDNIIVFPESLYTYTYATPNNTSNKNRTNSKYSRIFNIVNPTDFVTKAMPSAWGYGRYGTTYSLPTKTNDHNYQSLKSKMLSCYSLINNATSGNSNYHDYSKGESEVYNAVDNLTSNVHSVDEFYNKKLIWSNVIRISTFEYFQTGLCPIVNNTGNANLAQGLAIMIKPATSSISSFKKLSSFFIVNQGLSPKFADAHKMETYCAYMMGLNSDEVTTPFGVADYRMSYKGTVNCPVDIEIIDKETGEIVGRIVNNTVDEEIAAKDNSIVMTVDGDNKEYWLPSNGNYEVRLSGNDNGVMDYTLSEIDSDLGETARTNYYSLEVEKDKVYTSTLSGSIQDDPELSDFSLTDNSGKVVSYNEAISSDESVEYTVEIQIEGSGNATDTLTVTSGDYVTLTASPYRSEFIGWYQDDQLISDNSEYRFRPTENVTLTAKFSEAKPLLLGDVDDDGVVEIRDTTWIQRHIASIDIPFTFNNDIADVDGDGDITVMDATSIQYYLCNMRTPYLIGKPISTN